MSRLEANESAGGTVRLAGEEPAGLLSARQGLQVFLAFALAYFFSALVRAITATLSPTLTAEFSLSATSLGLLAGSYFLGFAATQLPLGHWLDRHGPKRVILGFLSVAVLGCLAFAAAQNFAMLLAARVLCGIGVSACLMAPLTGYRRWFTPQVQLRTNSWMLMSGSLGMVASTLPVQWLVPVAGWRGLFVLLAVLVALAMLVLAWQVPRWAVGATPDHAPGTPAGYAVVWRHPYFRSLTPMGFFGYGGFVAIQTLWAAPWMTRVSGETPLGAATGLFWLNICMLGTFWFWGWINPWLVRRGLDANRLMARGMPLALLVLALNTLGGSATPWWGWALFCMASSFVSLAQPALGMAFPQALAGRALSGYNLVIFSGVFAVQWGIGLLIDAFAAAGWSTVGSFQAAFGVYWLCSLAGYAWFLATKPHNPH